MNICEEADTGTTCLLGGVMIKGNDLVSAQVWEGANQEEEVQKCQKTDWQHLTWFLIGLNGE